MPFVPVVREVSQGEAAGVPGLEAAISLWTEKTCSAEEWLREASEGWGGALAMKRGDEQLGFLLYGPRGLLPRAARFPTSFVGEEAVVLAYVGGDTRTRRHLLARMLKESRSRGVAEVEAVACDVRRPWHVPTRFLLENGWKPVRRVWWRGLPYTIARVDLNNAVEVSDPARGLIGRVRLPALKRPGPVPGTFAHSVPAERVRAAGSRS